MIRYDTAHPMHRVLWRVVKRQNDYLTVYFRRRFQRSCGRGREGRRKIIPDAAVPQNDGHKGRVSPRTGARGGVPGDRIGGAGSDGAATGRDRKRLFCPRLVRGEENRKGGLGMSLRPDDVGITYRTAGKGAAGTTNSEAVMS